MTDGATSYNVYRGLLSTLRASAEVRTSQMTQFACGTNSDSNTNQLPDTTDNDVVPANDGFYYLVTSRNGSAEGPLAASSQQPARILDATCP